MNNILLQLMEYYCDITPKEELYNLGEHFNYYYADKINTNVLIRNLIKIDIKSAFPTLCKIIFGADSEFVIKLNKIESKLERNIFISNTLKNIKDRNYLIEMNNFSKIIVFSYIFNNYNDVDVFEFQKDGVLFTGKSTFPKNTILTNILKNNFIFHIDIINLYLRINKTSIYKIKNNIEIKGMYKNPPIIIAQTLEKIIENPYLNITHLKEKYNDNYLNLIKILNLSEELNFYFKFNNKYFLDKFGNRTTSVSECYFFGPLQFFLYPILTMLRTE